MLAGVNMRTDKEIIAKLLLLVSIAALVAVIAVALLFLRTPSPSGSTHKNPGIKEKSIPKSPAESTPTAKSPPSQSPAPVAPVSPAPAPRVLSQGVQGDDVSQLQARLTALGYSPGEVNGYFDEQTHYAVVAFQKVNGLSPDGIVGPITFKALANPVGITAKYSGNHVEIDKAHQVLIIVKDGQVVKIITTSTGRPGLATPSGAFTVYYKPGERFWSTEYGGWMIWSSFFNGGIAVHGFSSVPPYPASHGCVRIPVPDSKYVYDNMPMGSLVYVY